MNYKSFYSWEKFGDKKKLIKVINTIIRVNEIKFNDLINLLKGLNLGSNRTVQRMVIFYYYMDFIDICEGNVKYKGNLSDTYNLNDKIFYRFCEQYFKYNPIELVIFLSENTECQTILGRNIPLRYSNFRDFAISFEKLKFNIETNSYSLLTHDFTCFIKKKRNLASLERSLDRKRELGLMGEEFILNFEKKRLNRTEGIVRISDDDVSAGYDIKSYNNHSDIYHNRYIEVKTYTENDKVYLSRNEIHVSKLLKDNYFLYLVDVDLINTPGYSPIIIKNMHKNLFDNDLVKSKIELVSYEVSDLNKLILE
ncbi:MAG: DUF3883 domain-containing protein [Firmicutes bacterium]|jgi:hypothetical protein|nr:DUF3883 domain-containing protein [Bacillota bacterium]